MPEYEVTIFRLWTHNFHLVENPDWTLNQTTNQKQAERREGTTQNNDVLNSGLWNSRNEILPRSERGARAATAALIPELYLQSGWNGMRRKEAEVGGRERGGRIDFPGFVFQEDGK